MFWITQFLREISIAAGCYLQIVNNNCILKWCVDPVPTERQQEWSAQFLGFFCKIHSEGKPSDELLLTLRSSPVLHDPSCVSWQQAIISPSNAPFSRLNKPVFSLLVKLAFLLLIALAAPCCTYYLGSTGGKTHAHHSFSPGSWPNKLYCHAHFLYIQVASFLPNFKETFSPRFVMFTEPSSNTWSSMQPETRCSQASHQSCSTALRDLIFIQVKRKNNSFLVVQLLISETSGLQSLLQCGVSMGICYRIFGCIKH